MLIRQSLLFLVLLVLFFAPSPLPPSGIAQTFSLCTLYTETCISWNASSILLSLQNQKLFRFLSPLPKRTFFVPTLSGFVFAPWTGFFLSNHNPTIPYLNPLGFVSGCSGTHLYPSSSSFLIPPFKKNLFRSYPPWLCICPVDGFFPLQP